MTAAGLLVVIQWEVSSDEPTASSNPEIGEYKGSVGSCPELFVFLSAISPRFSLVLDPRRRLGGPGRKVGSACEKFEDNEGGVLG